MKTNETSDIYAKHDAEHKLADEYAIKRTNRRIGEENVNNTETWNEEYERSYREKLTEIRGRDVCLHNPMHEAIAEIYATRRADNVFGKENVDIPAWKKVYNSNYTSKLAQLERQEFIPNFSTPEEKAQRVLEWHNQKQFKAFNKDLAKAYVAKFSRNDQLELLFVVCEELIKQGLQSREIQAFIGYKYN